MKIEQELIILGLLKNKARHGYEIKKQIKEVVNMFAPLEVESIYYTLNRLEKKKFVEKTVSTEGRRPEKYIYSLTIKGGEYFQKLLTKSLLTVERPNFSIDISLYFLPFLPREVAERRLVGRSKILLKIEKALKNLADQLEVKSFYHLKSIVEHNLELLEAEKKFIAHLTKDVAEKKISKPQWFHLD